MSKIQDWKAGILFLKERKKPLQGFYAPSSASP
jgi:hypothetical protein